MDCPLKIQGRFVTEADVKEIKMLLQKHSSWNRSRLSRELCARWNWRRPDGQIKDMACREFLRKLEFRALIKLPPRQRPGPGRAPKIEPVEVNQSPISCLFWGCRLQDGIPWSMDRLGTCYKAANFITIGYTKGRSRQDRNSTLKVPIKDIFVYPLRRDFRKLLLA